MHLSFIRLLVLFTSLLVHSQETNSSESATAVSAPISVYSNSLNDGEAFPPTQNISRLSAAVPTTSLCHLQASSKDPQPRAYANVQVVWTATPTLNVMVPGSSFVSTSIISPDATLSATVTAGRSSAVDASSKTVQSTTATMSASMGIASGNPSSTVNVRKAASLADS